MEIAEEKVQSRYFLNFGVESNRACQRLGDGTYNGYFIDRSVNILSSYVAIRRQVDLSASMTIDVDDQIAQLAEILFTHLNDRGQISEISQIWSELIFIISNLSKISLRVQLMTQFAITENNLGNAKRAKSVYEDITASTDFLKISKDMQASIYHQIGVCCIRQGDYTTARTHFLQSLSLSKQCRNFEIQAYNLNQLGNLALLLGNFRVAKDHYDESLRLFKMAGEEDNLACVAYLSLGRLLTLKGSHEEAIPILEKGLNIRRARQESAGIANNSIYLASAYIGVNRLEEAEALLNESLTICREIGDYRGLAVCHLEFSKLENRCGNQTKAIIQITQALKVLDGTTLPSIELQVLVELFSNQMRQGKYFQSLGTCKRIIQNFRRQNLGSVSICRLAWVKLRQSMRSKRMVET